MIHSIDSSPGSLTKVTSNRDAGKTSEKTPGTFQQILENAAREKTTVDRTGTSAMENTPASSLQEISSPCCDFACEPTSIQPTIQDMTDELLDMLDMYSSQLESSETTLKSLEPMLDMIKTNAASLLEKAQNSPDTSEGLKEIAIQSAMVANNEYFKFQRGDYL